MSERKFFSRSDAIIIICIVVVAGLSFIAHSMLQDNEGDVFAEISLHGQLMKTVSLDHDSIFSLPESPTVYFEVNQGEIRFKAADCWDQRCVIHGFMHRPGQIYACLPNGLVLRLISNNPDVDLPDIIVQ